MNKNIKKIAIYGALIALTGAQSWGAAAPTHLIPIDFTLLPSGAPLLDAVLHAVPDNDLNRVQQLIREFEGAVMPIVKHIENNQYIPQFGLPSEVLNTIILPFLARHSETDQHIKNWRLTSREGAVTGARFILKDRFFNYRNYRGMTPLAIAAQVGHNQLVQMLLEGGASVDAIDNDGSSPLIRAARRGSYQAVRMLLRAGANSNRTDNMGGTALAAAAYWGYEQTVDILLNAGAVIDATDNSGDSALMVAITCGRYQVIQILLSRRPNIKIINKRGLTALDLATRNCYAELINILENWVDLGD